MSSCAASCCTYSPEASFASATLASSPTGGAPLSCRFAFNYSEPYRHRRPNQRPPLPSNRAHFRSVPNAAAAWWSSRDFPLPRSNSVLRPLSPESRHETNFPKPQTSIRLSARSALVRLAAEKSSCPCPKICSNRHHLLLLSPSASHTPLHPPSTPVHRLPYATHRRYTKPIATAPDRTAGRLPSSRCIKSDRRRF
jgi:hypothetical protein